MGKPYGDGIKVYPGGDKKKGFWREGKFITQEEYNQHMKELQLAQNHPEEIEKNLLLGKSPSKSPI